MPTDMTLQLSTALGDLVSLLEERPPESLAGSLREIADALARIADKAEEKEPPEEPEQIDFGPLIAALKTQKFDLAPIVKAIQGIKVEVQPAITVLPTPVTMNVEPAPVVVEPQRPIVTTQSSTRVKRIIFNTDRRGNIESADLVWDI